MRVIVTGSRPLPGADRIAGALARQRAPAQIVKRREIPYWQERGWVRQGNTYRGNYHTPFGAYAGLVEDRGWGDLRFYMFAPPRAIRDSGHWSCFQPRRDKGFHVHLSTRPADVSSGIMTIERLLVEAFTDAG